MAVAEHAQLIVDIKLNDGLSAGIRKTQADMQTLSNTTLPKLQAAIQRIGAGGGKSPWLGWKNEAILAVGRVKDAIGNLGDTMRTGLSRAASGIRSTFSSLGNSIRSTFSNIGKSIKQGIGIGIGFGLTNQIASAVGGVVTFFSEAAGKAQEFGVASSNLAKLLRLPIEQASALVDTLDKFGVSGSTAITAFGLLERNVGKYAKSAADAAKFQKQFGISLTDSTGALASPIDLLRRTVVFWNSNATATQKATALQALYGRGWKTLLPVLSLGIKRFNDEFGTAVTLTKEQTQALKNAALAQKDLNDALGDLQVAVGVVLAPIITDFARQLAAFIDANRGKITDAVKAVVGFAKQVGAAIQSLAPIGRSIADAWNAIPEGLRTIILAGIVGNKVLKMTIGFDPLDIVRQFVTNAVLGIKAGIVYVSGPMAPGGGVPGAPGGPKVPGAPVSDIVVPAIGGAIAIDRNAITGPGSALDDFRKSLKKDFQDIRGFTGFEGRGPGFRPGPLTPGSVGFTGFEGRGPGFRATEKIVSLLDQIHKDFLDQIGVLKTSTDPKAIAAAAAAAAADIVKGVGNVASTKDVISLLKAQIAATKDPALRKVLQDALRRVEAKLPGREWIAAQEKAARAIVNSQKSTKDKIAELTRIQQSLLSRGDTVAAGIIAREIDSLKPHIDSIASKINVTVTRLTGGGTTARPRPGGGRGGQNRPTVPVEPRDPGRNPRGGFVAGTRQTLTVNVSTTHRDTSKAATLHNRYGPTSSQAGAS